MADYLLVVDMQSDYAAVGKAYQEKLDCSCNDKLLPILATELSILNRFFLGEKIERRNLVTDLLVVSSRIFEKRRASCFTNPDLKDF